MSADRNRWRSHLSRPVYPASVRMAFDGQRCDTNPSIGHGAGAPCDRQQPPPENGRNRGGVPGRRTRRRSDRRRRSRAAAGLHRQYARVRPFRRDERHRGAAVGGQAPPRRRSGSASFPLSLGRRLVGADGGGTALQPCCDAAPRCGTGCHRPRTALFKHDFSSDSVHGPAAGALLDPARDRRHQNADVRHDRCERAPYSHRLPVDLWPMGVAAVGGTRRGDCRGHC